MVISRIINTELKQICCSYSRTQKSQSSFLIIYVVISEAETSIIDKYFLFFYKFPLPSSLLQPDFPYPCSGVPVTDYCTFVPRRFFFYNNISENYLWIGYEILAFIFF